MNDSTARKNFHEIRRESYTDSNGNTRTNVTRTIETVNNDRTDVRSYQNGYLQDQSSERSYQDQIAQRDTDSTAHKLILSLILTLLSGLIVGTWYFNQRDSSVDNTVTPSEVPTTTNTASPSPFPVKTSPESKSQGNLAR